ncbi:MAG TPA: hypothetical protein VE868_10885, partial [Balneolaceae bacterium]|nr:hypothetical protein [Balneolaceae bacterium]
MSSRTPMRDLERCYNLYRKEILNQVQDDENFNLLEIMSNKNKSKPNKNDTQGKLWEVFTQGRNGKPFEHAGSLHAPDGEKALENA